MGMFTSYFSIETHGYFGMSSMTGGYAQRPGYLPVQRDYIVRFGGPFSCSTLSKATAAVQHGMLANVGGLTVVV